MVNYRLTRQFRKNFLLLFLFAQLIFFIVSYTLGSTGIRFIINQKQEVNYLESQIDQLKSEINNLNAQFKDWQEDIFIKEKFARENLHMARPNEEIYIVV